MRRWVASASWLVGLGLLTIWCRGSAADEPAVMTAAPADTAAPAFENMFSLAPSDSAKPILFNNREITTLRSQVMGHSPGERAKLAGIRIHEVLRKTTSDSVRIKAAAGVAAIAVGEDAVFVLTPYDLDVERGETLGKLRPVALGDAGDQRLLAVEVKVKSTETRETAAMIRRVRLARNRSFGVLRGARI